MKSFFSKFCIAFLVMLFFATCEQNEELKTIEQPTSQIVAVNQDQHLTSLVNSIKNSSSSSARATSFLDNVNLNTAWKEVDEQHHLTNYSFTTNNNATYSKRTFVLTEYDGKSFGYIFELEADSIWLSEFSEFPGWEGFTGFFRILNLEEEILAETPMKDGRADGELISSNENGRNVTYEYFCPESYVTIGAYFNEITQHWEPEPIVHANPCYWIVIKDDRDWELGDIDPEDPYGENQGNGGSGGITFPTNEYECNPGSTRNANGYCVKNELLCGENTVYDLITETCVCKPGFEIDENGICSFDLDLLANIAGDSLTKEYPDKCTGVQDMWNSYPNNEVAGYLTADGKVILTDILGNSRGTMGAPYVHNGTAYYAYPNTQPAPSQNYTGMLNQAGYYFIPIVASIHTHTPCRSDGTNGISHPVGLDDKAFAQQYPSINHWVIGCGAIGQFDGSNSNFFNKSFGSLSNICGGIH